MAEGADIDFAYSVIEYKLLYPEIHLEAALPYPYAAPKRKTAYSVDKEHILSACDSVHIISPVYHQGCMDKRNRFMADKADTVLAVWNGIEKGGTWNTICYARKIGKPVRYIMLHDLDRLFF